MSALPSALAGRIKETPVLDAAKPARERFADLLAMAQEEAPDLAPLLDAHPKARDLLLAFADHSPFLWRLVRGDPARAARLLAVSPEEALATLLGALDGLGREASAEADLMRSLRLARQEVALLVALADCGGVWGLEEVTAALTGFADAAVRAALRHLLRELAASGRLAVPDPADPEAGSGLVVLALGKHGAGELNYSSDVDLVVFFDPERVRLAEGLDPTSVFVRLIKGLVRILQAPTGDGAVLRVDLRLRPDPGSTSTVVSLPAAYTYYETVGQNWERAAMIKARPVAGDVGLGEAFLADLAPFIWRKYFDFAAIADIHAMKRQIHAVRGHETIAVAGHDIKLGRGGIREIEFFVQTQQLVFGGRRPSLRGRATLDMLGRLVAEKWIAAAARDELSAAYRFLRRIEHRLQMVADEQTQRLPAAAADLRRFARFCGFRDQKAFAAALTAQAAKVERHYALLFEEGPSLAVEAGNLVFTGTADDPETLRTLERLGFRNPPTVCETVRGWHFGRRPAVTTPRAREVLTELVPGLLAAFGKTGDPDGALAAFDRALQQMPAAVELFSILKSHDALLSLFADILGSAPRLAEIAGSKPHVLDALIDPHFVEATTDAAAMGTRIRAAIGEPESFEDFLDRARDVCRHETFLAGARLLSGVFSPAMVGEAYAAVADAIIAASLDAVEARFREEHGTVPKGRFAVIGLGKLGGRELTASSDLDLVIVYDFDPEKPESSGRRPLHAVVYYTRLTQRLITALTAPTRRGTLYEIDMRLRPTGSKGPVATQFQGFLDYQAREAETWEHMALTRARPIAGDASLIAEAAAAIGATLRRRRDPAALARDVIEMRRLIAAEKGEDDPNDLKLAAGGLTDCEFLAQYFVLARAHDLPDLVDTGTAAVLARIRRLDLLPAADATTLVEAHGLMRDIQQWQRLAVEGPFRPDAVAPSVRNRIAAVAGLPDFRILQSHLKEVRGKVREIFLRVLGG